MLVDVLYYALQSMYDAIEKKLDASGNVFMNIIRWIICKHEIHVHKCV